jgi:PucR C-terminal helix-turn-helix domain
MTRTRPSLDDDPWRGLPPRVADLIDGEVETITVEILDLIASEVPEYARPLEGRFGRGIRRGVGEALKQFVALIRDPEGGRGSSRDVYLALGRGEQRAGRTLDSLQAAYRIGARVAWRRIADACRRAEVGIEALTLLAEAIFAYIDELAADSVEGYAQAQAEVEDVRRRRRGELAALLLADQPADATDLAAAARAASWEIPERLAALACSEVELARVARRLPPDALATVIDGEGCVLLPDPEGPGRAEALSRAAIESRTALGPTVPTASAAESWRLALSLQRAIFGGAGLLRVDDHLTALLLFESRQLTGRIAARRLATLAELTPKARERMRETALAYLRHDGNAVTMAAELHVHPQTARYRIARLRELLGEQLEDPDARFELELALRGEEVAGGV